MQNTKWSAGSECSHPWEALGMQEGRLPRFIFLKELKWRLGRKIKWKRENDGTGKSTFWAFLPDVLLELKGLREAKAFVSLKIRKQIY